jgi:hypothetical protein
VYEDRRGIVNDLDAVLLGVFGGEGRPISILTPLFTHHSWLVVVQITTHNCCVTLGTKTIRRKGLAKVT